MPIELPSPEKCIEEFDLDGDGLLSMAELGVCLEAGPWEVVGRRGTPVVVPRRPCWAARAVRRPSQWP